MQTRTAATPQSSSQPEAIESFVSVRREGGDPASSASMSADLSFDWHVVVEPPPCEALFVKYADRAPRKLLELIEAGRLKDADLTFAAEALVGVTPGTPGVVDALRKLLVHDAAVVREGALLGSVPHLTDDLITIIRQLAAHDPSRAVNGVASDLLEEREAE